MLDRETFFSIFLGIFILFICLRIYEDSDVFNLKCVISDVDGNKYCVRNRENIDEASDLLASTVIKCKKLVEYLKKKYPENDITKRLLKGFNPKKIKETLPTSEHTAYSENKGEKIAFCLNKYKHNDLKLIDKNTLMFVALHELTHVGTKEIGHPKQYWINFKYILEKAEEIDIYKPVDYDKKPQKYCGMTISDNPYFDLKD